jgi:hypothetical protein
MAFPALDAMRDGYDVYPAADVIDIVLTERLLKA